MIEIKGDEFFKKILAGERDFTGIKLSDLDLTQQRDRLNELNDYLKNRDLSNEPIILNEAELSFIKAGGLWLPYVKANRASFKGGDFSQCNFRCGEFPRASFYRTNLQGANCEACDFYNAYFKEAILSQTRFGGARLRFADLCGAKDLEKAVDLVYAHFERTNVTSTEQIIVMNQFKRKENYEKLDYSKLFRVQSSSQ